MIDIHCHILPGVDDGADSMEEAVEMARLAYEDGIRHIVATPHFNSNFRVTKPLVEGKVRELQAELTRNGIGITLHPGNEIRLEEAEEFYRFTQEENYCYLDKAGTFVLLEQRWSGYNPDTPEVLAFLKQRGVTAIIPHPERHGFFRGDPKLLASLIKAGAWTQVSVDSLLGKNREEAQQFAYWMIDHDYVSTLATDAHNTVRKPNLSEGFRIVEERAGAARAEEIRERMRRIVPEAE